MPKRSISQVSVLPQDNIFKKESCAKPEIYDLTLDDHPRTFKFPKLENLPAPEIHDLTQEPDEFSKQSSSKTKTKTLPLEEEFDDDDIAKIQLLIMPAQNGKTKVCIDMINDEIAADEYNGRSLHFVFTQNTSTNQEQFFRRLPTEKTITFGTKILNTQHAKNADELKGKTMFSTTNPQIIVMCAHSKRFEDIQNILKVLTLEDNEKCKRIFIYIDEIHEYINNQGMRLMVQTLSRCPAVKLIVGLTATPDKVFKLQENDPFWKQIITTDLRELSNNNMLSDDYFPLHEHTFVHHDVHIPTNPIEYARSIMSCRKNEFFSYDCCTFIPANVTQKSHIQMKDMIFQLNPSSVVFMLNGNNKSVFFQKDGFLTEKSFSNQRDELSKIIPNVIGDNRLNGRPVFITGNKCIKVGVSLSSPDIGNFTASIISHYSMHQNRQDDLYQMTARTAGNMKKWFFFRKTKIFCPSNIKDILLKKENDAFNAKRLAITYGSVPISRPILDEFQSPTSTISSQQTLPQKTNSWGICLSHENKECMICFEKTTVFSPSCCGEKQNICIECIWNLIKDKIPKTPKINKKSLEKHILTEFPCCFCRNTTHLNIHLPTLSPQVFKQLCKKALKEK